MSSIESMMITRDRAILILREFYETRAMRPLNGYEERLERKALMLVSEVDEAVRQARRQGKATASFGERDELHERVQSASPEDQPLDDCI